MATPWCRLWADMPNDPKWRTIAKCSNRTISEVMAVYVHMMANATNANERGRTQGWSDEDIASALDMETSEIEAIRKAMEGRVVDGDHLSGWDKRQPVREDGAAERSKQWRNKKKEEQEESERKRTQANADKRPDSDTDSDTDADKKIDQPEAPPPIPYHRIVDSYNKFCPSLARAHEVNPSRQALIKAAWIKYDQHEGGAIPVFDTVFKKAERSPFLKGMVKGKDGKTFRAKFDWIFNLDKMAKILEGDYDDAPDERGTPAVLQDDFWRGVK